MDDLEGKYFAFVFRANYFKYKAPLSIYKLINDKLEEIRDPVDKLDGRNWSVWNFLKENGINELYTPDKKVRKFKNLDMDFFEKEKNVNYPDRQSITWFRYWPLDKKNKRFAKLFDELEKNKIEVKPRSIL